MESIAIAPTLFAPLVVSNVVDPIPEGFAEVVPKLQPSFAPPEKRRFSVPTQTAVADQTAELTQFETFAFTLLGTCAIIPSRYRDVPGILMDCRSGFDGPRRW
jgi:hypothetical protein